MESRDNSVPVEFQLDTRVLFRDMSKDLEPVIISVDSVEYEFCARCPDAMDPSGNRDLLLSHFS
eukprot:XP_001707385.1 Hypothetical protein GL50803_99709 [Giardia lamblia ATCC 50803]